MQVTGSNNQTSIAQEIIKTIQLVPDGFCFSVATPEKAISAGRICFDFNGDNAIEQSRQICQKNNLPIDQASKVNIIIDNNIFTPIPADWDYDTDRSKWADIAGISPSQDQIIVACKAQTEFHIITTLNKRIDTLINECYGGKAHYIHPTQIISLSLPQHESATLSIQSVGENGYAIGKEGSKIKFVLPCRFSSEPESLFVVHKLSEIFSAKKA